MISEIVTPLNIISVIWVVGVLIFGGRLKVFLYKVFHINEMERSGFIYVFSKGLMILFLYGVPHWIVATVNINLFLIPVLFIFLALFLALLWFMIYCTKRLNGW